MRQAGDIELSLRSFFSSQGMVGQTAFAVAFSGGPDSSALLFGMAAIGIRPLRVIHVDHGIRGVEEREAECGLVKAQCRHLGLPLTIAHVRPGAIADFARTRSCGLEAAARAWRYHVFEKTMKACRARWLVLAHTRDDQLETILMRALSGGSCAGLRGIRAMQGRYLRPFLDVPKPALLDYLKVRGIQWSLDTSNEGDAFARNRLRQILVPALDAFGSSWEGGLLSTARKAAAEDDALAAWTLRAGFKPGADGRLVAGLSLLSEPAAIRERALLAAISTLLGSARRSSRLASAAFAALDSGKARYSGGGIWLMRKEDRLELSSTLDFPLPDGYFVIIERAGSADRSIDLGAFRILTGWESGKGSPGLRELAFSFPLIVRSRRPGDFLEITDGRKPIDALLAEWHVDPEYRGRVPILEDRLGIIGVLASGFGGKDRFRPSNARDNGKYFSIIVKGA